jgi:pseudaminic acid cytidylyltransferase
MDKDIKIALIPARGGSKRIPNKNIKHFEGKPIIAHSIEKAFESQLFDRIIVSTDSEKIATISQECGAEVPFIRPRNISNDNATLFEVQDHALKNIGLDSGYICMILPTAPLLETKFLIEGYEKIKNSKYLHTFSACSMPFTVQRTFMINDSGTCEMFFPENFAKKSQDFPEAYQDAGQFYWTSLNIKNKSKNNIMFGSDSLPIIIPRHIVQDIDTNEDWDRAELIFRTMNS